MIGKLFNFSYAFESAGIVLSINLISFGLLARYLLIGEPMYLLAAPVIPLIGMPISSAYESDANITKGCPIDFKNEIAGFSSDSLNIQVPLSVNSIPFSSNLP